MRPSDENQGPFTRPNLMSSLRRGGHEDSILARLERDPGRRAGAGIGVRLAWYGAAALVAIGLTATLAWLAADSGQSHDELARTERPVQPIVRPVAEPAPADPADPAAQAPVPATATAAAAAVIVEALPDPAMPSPAPVAADAFSVPAPAAATASASPPAPVPPLRLLERAGARPDPVKVAPDPVQAVAKAAPRREPQRSTPTPARARPPAPRQGARQAARPARSVNPARSDTHDDSDVALISAVIYHANGHADSGSAEAAPACADEGCRARGERR